MSRVAFFFVVLLALLTGALAWGLADADEWRLAYGALPVIGSGVILMAFARMREGREGVPHGAAVRVMLHFLMLGWIAHVALFTPFHPARAFLTLHVALAAGAGFLIWRTRGEVARVAMPLIVEVLLAGLWIMLVGAEITLRVFATLDPKPYFLQRDMAPEDRLACVRYRGAGASGSAAVNADGFRAPPFEHQEGKRTVLLLGDRNLTHGVGLDATPPATVAAVATTAAKDLVFWDATLPAVGTAEFEALLDEMLPRTRPDAVLIAIAPDDDLFDLARIGPSWRWLAMWMDRENVLLARLGGMLAARFRGETVALTGDATARGLALIDAVSASRGELLTTQLIATTTTLAARARAANVPFGVVLVPAPHMVDSARFDSLVAARPRAEREPPMPDLSARLAAHSIAFLDLTDVLATSVRAAGTTAFVTDDVTLNADGSRLAGIALAEFARRVLEQGGKRDR